MIDEPAAGAAAPDLAGARDGGGEPLAAAPAAGTAASTAAAAPPDARAQPLVKRLVPFAVAIALVGFVLSRLDLSAFAAHMARVNYVGFMGFTIAMVLALLAADTFATVLIYRQSVGPVGYKDFFVLRGASYLPSVLNHHVGQAFLTYVLAKEHGVNLLRVAGSTLLVYASWVGCLLGGACIALLLAGQPAQWLAIPLGTGLAYLAVLAWRPRALATHKLLAPLFEAGIRGHFVAVFARIPHFVVLFLGTWVPFWFFDVNIPFAPAAGYIPLVMVAGTLPITPQGFGTRDVLAAQFFERFAAGDTSAQRLAAVAAATTTYGIAITLVEAGLGLFLMRRVMARLVRRAG